MLLQGALVGLMIAVWANATSAQIPAHSDATHDWLLINGITSGIDPFSDVAVFAAAFDVPFLSPLSGHTSEELVAYRTPGALVLLWPLTEVPWQHSHLLFSVVGIVAFALVALVFMPKYLRVPVEQFAFPLVMVVLSIAFREAAFWGAMSSLIGLLLIILLLKPSRASSGFPLAIAAVLKPWAGLAFIPLIIRRVSRPAALVTGIALTMLTVLGGVIFDISVSEAVRLFDQGSDAWLTFAGNISLGAAVSRITGEAASFVWVTALGVGAALAYGLRRSVDQSLAVAVCLAVLVSPLSWLHYDLVVLPAVFFLWTRWRTYLAGGITAAIWLLVQVFALRIAQVATPDVARGSVLIARILLVVAIAIAPAALWHRPNGIMDDR